jgi:hypothetical protein
MPSTTRSRRTLSALVLCSILSMPLQAQGGPTHGGTFSGFLSILWARVRAPFAALWSTDDSRGGLDPFGHSAVTPPPPQPDSRGGLDPFG